MTFAPATIPTLETERLWLRGLRRDDLDGFCAIYADAEHARFVGGVKSRHAAWEKLLALLGHWQLFGWGRFAVEDKASGEFLGHCGPTHMELGEEPEINYSLTPAAQGRGVATEAVRRAVQFAYRELGWKTAISMIDRDNHRSQNVARKLGAEPSGPVDERDGYAMRAWRYPPAEQFLERHP